MKYFLFSLLADVIGHKKPKKKRVMCRHDWSRIKSEFGIPKMEIAKCKKCGKTRKYKIH